MKRTITISVDQLYRAQPGGIGTYVRGLASGLAALDESSLEVLGLAPRGSLPADAKALPLQIVTASLSLRALTRLWPFWPLGVPKRSNVVHATSMAGPFGGGARAAVHSVALHDLLWRDEPAAATRSGARFHEARLQLLARREDVRIFTSSPGLGERLIAEGFERSRFHSVRLGVDDDSTPPASEKLVRELLSRFGVSGSFTLYAGTREPRKNIGALIEAHRMARSERPEIGPLVLVGPAGWGAVATLDATVLGAVERPLLKGLYRDATLFAYVPRAEGWGLPPVEALHAGTRVVASSSTPSVVANAEVVLVDALDSSSISEGLLRAVDQPTDEVSNARRRKSVADLTWRNCARDHLVGWQ